MPGSGIIDLHKNVSVEVDDNNRVSSVSVRGIGIDADYLARVVELPKLRSLTIGANSLSAEDLVATLANSKLQELNLGQGSLQLPDDQLQKLGSIPTLKSISVHTSKVAGARAALEDLNRRDLRIQVQNPQVQALQQQLLFK